MIPKIIHYCWLSNDPYPEKIQRCMDSWKKYLPDYEFIHWNFKKFPRGKSKWVDQAYDNKKYAFAADYIRAYALYNYGGIYLDTDVEVLKSFDDLLDLPYFLGRENSKAGIEAAALGCEKGHFLIKDILDSYNEKSFVNPDGSLNVEPMPNRFRSCIDSKYHYRLIDDIKDFDYDESVINVFPADYFSPKRFDTNEIEVSDRTYSVHHFAASWAEPYNRAHGERLPKLKKIFGNRCGLVIGLCVYAIHRFFYKVFNH